MQIAAVAAAYYATAKLGISLDVAEGVVTPVWAPTGVALAALLLFGYRVWPGVALGAFAANATSGVGLAAAAGIASGNTLEGVTGAFLLGRVRGFRASLARARDVLALVILGGVVSTTLAATIGSATLWAADEISRSNLRSTWFLWWFGDTVGALTVAPLLLAWAPTRKHPLPPGRVVEASVLAAALIGAGLVVFLGDRWEYPYVIFPLLVWAAIRFGLRGAATANFVVTAIAVWATVDGSVLIEGATPTETAQILQALIAVVAVSMLIAAATVEERTRAEDALTGSLSLLQATLDSTADGVLVVDLEGRILSYNQQFLDLWRMPADLIAARDDERVQQFMHDELADASSFLARVREVYARRGEESMDVLLFQDGRVFERHSRPQRVGDRIVGRVWSFRDVTEARRAEVLQRRFLDMASHEMRNPLGVVSALATSLVDDWDTLDGGAKQEYVQRIRHQSDHLSDLVNALLMTSRVDAGKLEPRLRPMELADAVRHLTAEQRSSPVVVYAPTKVIAVADAEYVRNMLLNYLTNAEKYGHPPVTIDVGQADGFAEVRVGDAGPGIPPELRSQLFERFSPAREALNPRSPGTGLGLWIVRELARAQSGDAWYEPGPDGPQFCFKLPLAE